jgi:serine/threonine protein kinase
LPALWNDCEGRTRYGLVRELGHGAMGAVWLAYDRVLRRPVALKRLLASSAIGILRLKREFRVIAPLLHRNLVRLYELWSDEDVSFFTMEFIDGRDLRFVLLHELSSLSVSDRVRFALDLATQILPALGFLHARGVIHRDLKPSNLMLVDFGILASIDDERAVSFDRRGAGTPPYVAPEQARGEPPTPASDMFSMGVLLVETIVGGLGHHSVDHLDSDGMRRCLDRVHPEPPRDLAVLCDALLQWDHKQRPDARSALAALAGRGTPLPRAHPSACMRPGASAGPDEVKEWLAPLIDHVADAAFEVAIVEEDARGARAALLRWAHDVALRSGGLVLVGGGQPREHVAYNVLDTAIDALASILLETVMDAELARDLSLASTAFPVLAGKRSSSSTVSRSRAFDALIRILASLAGAAGVYLLVDDLHRADSQSLAFLDRLLERRPAGVAVIATLGADKGSVRSWLDAQLRIVRCRVAASTSVWTLERHRSSRAHLTGFDGNVTLAGRLDGLSTQAGRQFAKPEDAHELRQGGGDVPAIRAKGHGQPVGRLLLGGGGFDEGEPQNPTLLVAARR